jgi:hypothetical protein
MLNVPTQDDLSVSPSIDRMWSLQIELIGGGTGWRPAGECCDLDQIGSGIYNTILLSQ